MHEKYLSPYRLFSLIAVSIFLIEMIIMFLLSFLSPLSWFTESFVDAMLLAFLVYPILYFFMFKPMRDHISERGRAEKEIRKYQDQLENMVKERTAELTKANETLKDNQEKLIQSAKMSAMGQLMTGIIHEINNPLSVILGFCQSVMRRINPGDPLEMPMKSIEKETLRCKNFVQEILSFSHIDNSGQTIMNINKAVEEVAGLVHAKAKMSSVEIKTKLNPDLPPILGNPNRIQQVIVNLSNNGIDAMAKGGVLNITTEVCADQSQPRICLKISDTGTGIPDEIKSKIFEPFFTTKPVGKGTGLGLSLVYEIVQKHKGTIEVESEFGKGTTFRVFLPVYNGEYGNYAI